MSEPTNPQTPAAENTVTRRSMLKYLAAASSVFGVAAKADAQTQSKTGITLPDGTTLSTDLRTFLAGQTAVVTGAARGIGQAIAGVLAAAGANVVGVDICANIGSVPYPLSNTADLAQTGQIVTLFGAKWIPVVADQRSLSAMQGAVNAAINNFGRVDIFCANAGINVYNAPIQSITDAQWQDVLDVNLTGYANCIRAVAPNMIQNQKGAIVCTASVDGREGERANASYATSKWGVIGLVKSAALDLGRYNIRVNGVAPGTVLTGMTLNQASFQWTNPSNPTQAGWEAANLAMNALPAPYLLPEDIAEGVLYLASNTLSRYVTGTILDIAQGRNARYTA